VETFLEPAGRSNGLYFDREGKLIACADEKSELWRIDPATKKATVILDNFEKKPFNGPNDVWGDPAGGIYFTDPFYKRDYWQNRPKPEQEKQRLYYLPKGAKTPVIADETLVQPNGIIGTPDGKLLFVADIGDKKTYQYEIAKDGKLTNRKLFCEMGSDGMTRDTAGNLYLTGKGVTVFDKDGKKLGDIPIPESWTANVTFGGADLKTLFITAMDSVYTLEMAVPGIR
jgi:gluconolactonase